MHTLGSLATLGILKAAMVDMAVALGMLGASCNLGLLAEKAARVMPDGSDKSRSCRDAMVDENGHRSIRQIIGEAGLDRQGQTAARLSSYTAPFPVSGSCYQIL
jgi:hypothetical protein